MDNQNNGKFSDAHLIEQCCLTIIQGQSNSNIPTTQDYNYSHAKRQLEYLVGKEMAKKDPQEILNSL